MKREGWPELKGSAAGWDWRSLELYAELIEHWNRAVRLVGPRDPDGIRLQIVDSLLPFLEVPVAFPLLDIGSGAGLPGIALAIAFPPTAGPRAAAPGRVVCLEALGKRVSFLRYAARELGLGDVTVVGERAEEAAALRPELRGAFATVTARAVADVPQVLGLAGPYLRPGGRVVLPRGSEVARPAGGWSAEADIPYAGPPGLGARRVQVYVRSER